MKTKAAVKKRAKSFCAVPASGSGGRRLMGLTSKQVDEITKLADKLDRLAFGDAGAKARAEKRMKALLKCVS